MTEEEELQRIDQLAKQKRKRWLIVMITLLAVILGGTTFMIEKNNEQKQQEQDYMIKVVKSEEAHAIFEHYLKNIDPKAFTSEGVVHSFTINYDYTDHNPMGGIDTEIWVNNDRSLAVQLILNKDNDNKLTNGSGSYSAKLDNLISEEQKNA